MGASQSVGAGTGRPLVSIGMPTYNGARFIGRSIEALLAQDYPNWRLFVSDNASGDETESIVRGFALRDDRITYSRSETNVGAAGNFNRALAAAEGPYFFWAADHDLWEPSFVSTCVAALEANPAAILAYPESLLIDEDDAPIETMDDQLDVTQPSALARYKRLMWRLHVCNMVYGVARTAALRQIGGFAPVIGADHLVLAGLGLQGTVVCTGGKLFKRRQNRRPETEESRVQRQTNDLVGPQGPRGAAKDDGTYRALRDRHLRLVWRSRLSLGAKLEASLATLACFNSRFGVRSVFLTAAWHVARLTGQMHAFESRIGDR